MLDLNAKYLQRRYFQFISFWMKVRVDHENQMDSSFEIWENKEQVSQSVSQSQLNRMKLLNSWEMRMKGEMNKAAASKREKTESINCAIDLLINEWMCGNLIRRWFNLIWFDWIALNIKIVISGTEKTTRRRILITF